MADSISFRERIGLRRASGVGEAGWGRTLVVALISLIYFLPVLFIIFTAIKPQELALSVPPTFSPTSFFGLIPDQFVFTPTLENFGSVFSRVMTTGSQPESTGFDRFFFNSIVIASVSVLLALAIGTLAAYGFSRYPLKGNDTYLFIILTTRMLPAIVVIIPVILMFRAVGLSGSYPGIILLYTAFNLAFTIWMMKSFFDELSTDVEDAARIDGSSEMKVFFKICLPQVVAGLAATFVFGLILTWTRPCPPGGAARIGRCWPPSKPCSSFPFSSSRSSCRITCCGASPSARSRSSHVDH